MPNIPQELLGRYSNIPFTFKEKLRVQHLHTHYDHSPFKSMCPLSSHHKDRAHYLYFKDRDRFGRVHKPPSPVALANLTGDTQTPGKLVNVQPYRGKSSIDAFYRAPMKNRRKTHLIPILPV